MVEDDNASYNEKDEKDKYLECLAKSKAFLKKCHQKVVDTLH